MAPLLLADGGAGDDVIVGSRENDRLDGGAGQDRITGGRGTDRITGGSGRDVIKANDATRDRVLCGGGRDRATTDRRDTVRGCEQVNGRTT